MKKMSKWFFLCLFAVFTVFVVNACSKSEEGEEKEHFASSQQKALEKAKGVEDMLKDTEEKRRKEMEEESK